MDRSLRLREMMMMGGWRWCAKDNSEGGRGETSCCKDVDREGEEAEERSLNFMGAPRRRQTSHIMLGGATER
jgi:hypothetical protein